MKALILIDIQNDFLPGGSLAVPEGDKIIPLVNSLIEKFSTVLATQDFHPKGHKSFASTHGKKPGELIPLGKGIQILWPDHCVQGSKGAEFANGLNINKVEKIFQKGTDLSIDSYSAFLDNDHKNSTGLGEYLKEKGIKEIYLAGLASDYCVKYSALDGLQLGFDVYVISDACRGINMNKGDTEKAFKEIEDAGGKIVLSSSL